MIDLSSSIAGLNLPNPICLASGTCGFGDELRDFMNLDRLGAIFTKAVTREVRRGNRMPRLAETEHGLLNSIGLANPGIDGFEQHKWPWLQQQNIEVIVNVAGAQADDYAYVAERLSVLEGIRAIELNLSCPNVKEGGIAHGSKPDIFAELIKHVRRSWPGMLIVKMTPQVSNVAEMARIAEASGADALSLINTIPGMAIDLKSRRPKTITNTSGYSGAAIKPIALAQVFQASRAVTIPIIGIGGIYTVEDVVEFLLAGACAVQIGTATFTRPSLAVELVEGLENWMLRNEVKSTQELIGAVRPWS
jgi:dihydroorotate dehydrogenase (NAD+) catalytic subunit